MTGTVRREFVWGAFVLRITLGMLFFVAGLNKFIGGVAGIQAMIAKTFAATWLPAFAYVPFAYVLPYLEVAFGVLILLGLFRLYALALGSLLMVALAFGMLVASQSQVAFANIFYVSLFVAALFTSPWDKLSLDTLIQRPSRAA